VIQKKFVKRLVCLKSLRKRFHQLYLTVDYLYAIHKALVRLFHGLYIVLNDEVYEQYDYHLADLCSNSYSESFESASVLRY
jgi:hypothetical protein